MKTVIHAFLVLTVLTFVTGLLYPLAITAITAIIFPVQSRGSLVYGEGHVAGSRLIGQNFTDSSYFQPRPSATNYSAMPSGGSNLNPVSGSLRTVVDVRRAAFQSTNGLDTGTAIPNDMLFASGSGLDPEISPDAARLQMDRIARNRHFTDDQRGELHALVERSVIPPQFGILGSARVNVLRLNQDLDRLSGSGVVR